MYHEKGYSNMVNNFVNEYYDSVGANLVPMPYYAKFIAIIYKKGVKNLVKLLVNFLILRKP